MSANVFSARLYQKECSMATARSKVGWTAGAHEVGKETFPSLPPGASSARAARDEASRKDAEMAKARRLALMWKLHGETDAFFTGYRKFKPPFSLTPVHIMGQALSKGDP